MKLFLGSDHGGFLLKESLKTWLHNSGHEVVDCGNTVLDPSDDYPDFAFAVADAVAKDPQARGILLCRSGAGVTIAANKVKGIRAAVCITPEEAAFNRAHDDLNVLSISGDHTPEDGAQKVIEAFLTTPFAVHEERHLRRVKKIIDREK